MAKVHLNFTREEFWDSTHAEIYKMWESHIKFNGWAFKETDKNKGNVVGDNSYKQVNIEDIPFF